MSEYENKQFEDTGFETPTTNAMVSEKSKIVAAVLAFFLGGFGIHRFYVGKIGSGLVMLILWFIGLFTFFLPTLDVLVWSLIDFVIILCGGFKDGKGLPIK